MKEMELTKEDVGKEYLIIRKFGHPLIDDTSKVGDVIIAYEWTACVHAMGFKLVNEDALFYLHPFTELKETK